MNRLNAKQKMLGMIMLILLAVLTPVFLWSNSLISAQDQTEEEISIQFSHGSGFYGQNVELKLGASKAGTIYYTLNGASPLGDDATVKVYDPEEGISLDCNLEECVYNIKAALRTEDNVWSREYAACYIVGKQVQDRYDMKVLSIFGEPADLTDGTNAILATENRDYRGREWERAVNIVLFDQTGDVMLDQRCGARVFGTTTRRKNQVPLKLYARSEYDEKNRFECVLFEDYSKDNALITGCKRVIVRSGGSDNGYAHIRSEFAERLCLQAGFPDAQASSPVCVYINGVYYGTYWFVESFDASYFEKKYGEYTGEMVVLENNIAYSEPLDTDDEITLEVKDEYNTLYTMLAELDLTDEDNWKLLNESIDVENFLQYMALQNYFGNADAMVNNFKTYRYYANDGDYREGTVFDGRYRFLLFDMDQTLGFGAYDKPGSEPVILDTANRVGYDIFYNSLFRNIVGTEAGRDTYVRYYLALINYYCEPGRAGAVLDEMDESRAAELRRQYAETDFMVGNPETPKKIDYNHVIKSMNLIREFLKERPRWALHDLEEAFGLNSRYTLSLQNPGEAYITVDEASFSDTDFEGAYYSEIPVTLTAQPKCGDQFVYWLVDGVEYSDPVLLITEELIQDETVFVECVTKADPDAGLMITAIHSRGGNDYVELTNFGANEVDLAEYTIGDDEDRGRASTLPSVPVAPGNTIRIYCKNYTGAEAIGQPEVNFNIKGGEEIYFYRKRLLQKVYVPKLGTKDGVYRMDTHSGIFHECIE